MMNATNIASAHILDIVFDGRNKAYGAYQLQRNYSKRMALAMSIVLSFCALIFVLGMKTPKLLIINLAPTPIPDSLTFVDFAEPQPKPVPTPETPRQTQQVGQTQFTVPVIVSTEVLLEDMLPPVSEISAVGLTTHDGAETPLSTPASVGEGNQQLVTSIKVNEDTIYTHAENLPAFPGDWRRFLERNLQYPETAIKIEFEGTVRERAI